jgi:hypothetical protein
MNFLRALILSLVGVFLLMVLWPLFVFFVLVIGAYWLVALARVRTLQKNLREPSQTRYETPHTSRSDIKVDEAIDVVFTEKEEG